MNWNKTYDNSQVVTYQSCPMKYYLQYIKGLVKSDTANDATLHIDYGDKYHKFLEAYYKRQMNGTDESIDLLKIWSYFEDREGEVTKTRFTGIELCKAYIATYCNQDTFEVLEVEKPCVIDLGGYKFIVKRDGVIKENDNIYAFEHKTTGKLNRWYFDQYFINSQMDAQTYVTLKDYGSCSGVMLNIAQPQYLSKPSSPLLQPDDPNVKLYSDVEIKYSKYHKADRAYCQGFKANFDRDIISRTTNELEEWENNTIEWIKRIEESKESNKWLKSSSGYNCKNCQYKEICKVSKGTEIDECVTEVMYDEVDSLSYLKENFNNKEEQTK